MTTGVGRLSLLASAVAGRPLDVAPAEVDTRTWTDGSTVFVDQAAAAAEQVLGVVVQACLLGAGSLNSDVVTALQRRTSLVSRYLAVEAHRALSAHETLLPGAARMLLDRDAAARSDSAVASLAIATGREPIDPPPPVFGTILPRRVRLDASFSAAGTSDGQPRKVMAANLEEIEGVADSAGPEGDGVDVFSPLNGGGAIGRLLKRMLRDARNRDTGPPGLDATHYSRHGNRISRAAALTSATAILEDDVSLVRPGGWSYPEWDLRRKTYRANWCLVNEVPAQTSDGVSFDVSNIRALRRSLGHVGLDVERLYRQSQGDDIDIDAVVDGRLELAAGSVPDEKFYVDNVRRRRDLAVLVLLDVSGSAAQPGASGVAVHESQRSAAAALTTALHGLGDRVALYAFRSMGRRSVQFTPVKRFDDAAGSLMLRRLDALAPGAYTRLGAAIRHGAAVLEAGGGTGRRLLVVLSDGFAYDHGYEGAYGEADARRALAEARRRGTGCVCLSIGGVTDADALRRVFGTAAHACVPRIEQLPGVVAPLFRAGLRSAEAQRRSWQRTVRTRELLAMDRRTA